MIKLSVLLLSMNNIFKFSTSRKLLFKCTLFLSRVAVNSIEHLQNRYRFLYPPKISRSKSQFHSRFNTPSLRVSTSLSESKSTRGFQDSIKISEKNMEKALTILT